MRILYVEDQLADNIDRIIRIFKKQLGEKLCKKLKKLAIDESDYGIPREKVKELLESSGVIDVEYTFQGAIARLKSNTYYMDEYAFFIVDRNLIDNDYNQKYSLEEIQAIDSGFKQSFIGKYNKFEGDYLLELLINEGVDIREKFFFLTANAKSELANWQIIQHYIDVDRFSEENIIEKGFKEEDKSYQNLKNKMDNYKELNIRKRYSKQIKILDSLSLELSRDFMMLMLKKDYSDPRTIKNNLWTIRNLVIDNLLKDVALRLIPANDECWKSKAKKEFNPRKVAQWFRYYDQELNDYQYKHYANSIIENYLKFAYSVGSDFGAHKNHADTSKTQATSYTVNSLVFGLIDIIHWYGQLIKEDKE